MEESMALLLSTIGTGKKFMVAYGDYGGNVEVHVISHLENDILFGYTDQTSAWIPKSIIKSIMEK